MILSGAKELRAIADKTWVDTSDYRPVTTQERMLSRAATALRAVADDIEVAERITTKAPHEQMCASLWRYPDGHVENCDCWKAELA